MSSTRHHPVIAAATQQLAQALGHENVRTDPQSLHAASFDNTRIPFPPHAVVHPRTEADIATTLQLANTHHVPVTIRGAGSGCAGAAAPIHGGWVLSLAHWTRIAVDATASLAHVQPGAITADIDAAAAAHGLFYPPDPSSVKYCTIGGNIATNAGGLRAAKYGVCRDYIYALEGFLPTGRFVRWGGPLRKYASGYNMKDLWIGSEGTLGVITHATLKLIPRPQARHTFLLAFPTDEHALEAAVTLLAQHRTPSVLEFLDTQTVACAQHRANAPVFPEAGASAPPAILLVEIDGAPGALSDDIAHLRAWARRHTPAWRETADPAEAETLWNTRRTCSQAMYQLGNAKLNEDIVVPLHAYIPLIQHTREIHARTHLPTPTFGHAADGNFHIHIMYDRNDSVQRLRAQEGIRLMMEKVVALGGAITGEHGIGIAKSPFLRLQHTTAEIDAMLAIKHALDPNHILAPGQIFDITNVWDHTPVTTPLPWDKH
ncbi:MAG: FAD-binding protein [Puniceicoccales bacterium]|jgi:glycolate oxidase|nr:FAD-binding protein [Puniceicoccales bacterium]